MQLKIRESALVFIMLCFSVSTFAANGDDTSVENLPADIRSLLQQEMIALDSAMKGIVSANAAGDHQHIASVAREIKDSFILNQNLTKHQKHELHSKLPVDFIEQDQQFHYLAGMLEHAAENNKSELIVFYYAKLFEGCATCHNSHAKHRFPKFVEASTSNEHHH
jgi:hypothetical protein